MRTFVDYFHDEDGNVIKRRTHYGNQDEKASVGEKRTGDRFYDIGSGSLEIYDETKAAWVLQ